MCGVGGGRGLIGFVGERPAGAKAHDPLDPGPTTPLRQIAGNVATTSTSGTAWYRLVPVP